VVAGRRRREYRLTEAGAETLAGRRSAWRDFAAMISSALEGTPWPNPA
jgi:DNA-binding PadR family transcriptional regulator